MTVDRIDHEVNCVEYRTVVKHSEMEPNRRKGSDRRKVSDA